MKIAKCKYIVSSIFFMLLIVVENSAMSQTMQPVEQVESPSTSVFVVDSIYYCGEITLYNVQRCHLYYIWSDGSETYVRPIRRQYLSVSPLDVDLICKGIIAKNKKRKRNKIKH